MKKLAQTEDFLLNEKSSCFLKNSRHVISRKGNCLVASNYNFHPSTKKRIRKMFHKDYGDIPVVCVIPTGKFIDPYNYFDVVNLRGQAYGLRNAKRFRKAKHIKMKNKLDLSE